jgi:hypothetical protein
MEEPVEESMIPEDPNPADENIPVGRGGFVSLYKHPLGIRLLDYIKTSFLVGEGNPKEVVTQDMINEILKLAIRYNGETLELYESMDENPNPITIQQFKYLLKMVISFVVRTHGISDNLDQDTVNMLVKTLVDNYQDIYMLEYMKVKQTAEDFVGRDPGKHTPFHMLTPESQKYVDMKQEKNERPVRELTEEELIAEREKIKRIFPEKWHDQLLPPGSGG